MYTNQQISGDYCIFFTEKIGQGSYANIYGAKQLSTSKLICVKVMIITQENEKYLTREIEILQKLKELDNPNLIKIYDISKQNNQILIFMERCKQNLGEYIANNNQQKQLLPLIEIIDIAKQIINGYRDLYSHNIIHRDLKPENLLIGTDNKIKICDFGFGKILNFDNQFFNQSILGTPLYVSPQALMTGKYTSKTDVYSFGLIVYFLIFQQTYYNKVKTLEQLIQKIITLDKEFYIGEFQNQGNGQNQALLQYILYGCIKFHEKDRFNWEQLFEIFDQITIPSIKRQSNSSLKKIVNREQHCISQTSQKNFKQEEQLQYNPRDQQTKTYQKQNLKPPLRQNSENGERSQFRITNNKQSIEKDHSSKERQNKSQENNQTIIRDTSNENMNLKGTQTPQRTNSKHQVKYTTQDRSRKYRIDSSNEKDRKVKNTRIIIQLQQKKQVEKQSKFENDSILKRNLTNADSRVELKNKEYLGMTEQNIQQNQFIELKQKQDQVKQPIQNNYFKQNYQSSNNDEIQEKMDINSQQNYETQFIIIKQIIKGIFAKLQLAEKLYQYSNRLIQILDYRLDLFRFLLNNYQQSVLLNIYSIYIKDKNLLQYPLQNQLLQFIDPINYILDDRFQQKMNDLKIILQKLHLKNQLVQQQIDNILIEKEKYNVEDIAQLIQTDAIKYNYESIVESYRNHFYQFLEQQNYDLSQIKSGELLKFLGYSTKFILSESLYSIEKLKTINIEEIPNLSDNSLILEKFIKENCKKNLKL